MLEPDPRAGGSSTVEAICDDVLVMFKGKIVEAGGADVGQGGASYSRPLISSVQKLDPGWLDELSQDPELVAAFSKR